MFLDLLLHWKILKIWILLPQIKMREKKFPSLWHLIVWFWDNIVIFIYPVSQLQVCLLLFLHLVYQFFNIRLFNQDRGFRGEISSSNHNFAIAMSFSMGPKSFILDFSCGFIPIRRNLKSIGLSFLALLERTALERWICCEIPFNSSFLGSNSSGEKNVSVNEGRKKQ